MKDQEPDPSELFWASAFLEPVEMGYSYPPPCAETAKKWRKTSFFACRYAGFHQRMRAETGCLLFFLADKADRIVPSWGILTGVRPIKLMRRLTAELGEEGAKEYFKTSFWCLKTKTELAAFTMKTEQKLYLCPKRILTAFMFLFLLSN